MKWTESKLMHHDSCQIFHWLSILLSLIERLATPTIVPRLDARECSLNVSQIKEEQIQMILDWYLASSFADADGVRHTWGAPCEVRFTTRAYSTNNSKFEIGAHEPISPPNHAVIAHVADLDLWWGLACVGLVSHV